MKFSIPVICKTCGTELSATGYGEKDLPPVFCQNCKTAIFLVDPLSFSIVSHRLLYRSRAEIDGGDPTMSIICSAIAVEAALTQLFVKWRKIECNIGEPTAKDRVALEKEYKDGSKRRFVGSADFVSKYLTNQTFDDFVTHLSKKDGVVALIGADYPRQEDELSASQIQRQLFDKRNRIMHWGDVGFGKNDAQSAFNAACNAISILTSMDRQKCEAMERSR